MVVTSFANFLVVCSMYSVDWAQETFKSLTLKEKITQMIMIPVVTVPARNPLDLDLSEAIDIVRQCQIGGIIFMDGTTIKQQEATRQLQFTSNIPLLIAQDGEWGLAMRLVDKKPFPKQMQLGLSDDFDTIFNVGSLIGKECNELGVHTPLAPVVDINSNPHNPVINVRSFSQNPATVCACADYLIKGLQSQGVLACAKHFPGHGDTHVDSHVGLPIITKTLPELYDLELVPFIHMIKNGIDMIMMGHLLVPCLDEHNPASLSRVIVDSFLRKQLGFKGLIITDALRMGALNDGSELGETELRALKAGNDILLCPGITTVDAFEKMISHIEKAVCNNEQLLQEIDQHVMRILRCKEWLIQNGKMGPI